MRLVFNNFGGVRGCLGYEGVFCIKFVVSFGYLDSVFKIVVLNGLFVLGFLEL